MNPEEYARMHTLETNYWWFAGRRAIIATLLGGVAVKAKSGVASGSGLHLLDIGCGTGANLPMLQSFVGEGGTVTGIDFSPLALRFAGDHLGAQRLSLLQGDALHLPFRDGSFDAVTMLDVLEHLSDDGQALREVNRVLRPGGAYIWSVPAYQSLWSMHDEALHHFRRYEYHDLRALLLASDFRISKISFAMSLMPPLAWLWRRLVLPFQPRRPQDAQRHSEGAVLPTLPQPFNRALVKYLETEGCIIARRPLNFGTSLVGVARKRG